MSADARAELAAPLSTPAPAEALTRGRPAWVAEAQRPRRPPVRSVVASLNAHFRRAEADHPAALRILRDPWAAHLAEGLLLQIIRFARFLLPPLHRIARELQTAHCVRHRAIDELVLRAVERDGHRQVVVVGAGYDMRPSRFAGRLAGVRWFEVDLPAMAARKQRLLARLPGTNRSVRHVAVDLDSGALGARLVDAGFDPARPACFVLEGLIHYLSAEALAALLDQVTEGPGRRRVVLSFIRSEIYLAARSPLRALFRLLGEIPRQHFTWTELAHVCARHGLRRFEAWTYADQVACFAPIAAGRPVGSTQDVAQADKGD